MAATWVRVTYLFRLSSLKTSSREPKQLYTCAIRVYIYKRCAGLVFVALFISGVELC